MKTLLTLAWLGAAMTGLFAAPFSDLSFEAASNEAARTGRIVLVDFYTTWCGPCTMLDKNTWTDAEVMQLLKEKTVPLRIDAEKETALAKRYKIGAYPSVLLIKPDGTEIDRLVGYREPGLFVADFHAALAGKDSVSRAHDAVMAAGTNDASARMQFGLALAQKGRDAEALSEYLWCFDHGLDLNTGFSGVRLSYLLMHIKSLAAGYPPARKALETRRDERQAKVAAGATDTQTIMDLVSLNNTLDQKEKNFAVYDHLPAGSMAKDYILMLSADQFLKAKRYTDFLQGQDGTSSFQRAVERYNTMLDSLGKESPMRERMEETMRQMAVTVGAHCFEALAGLKRDQDGKKLAGQILKFDSSPATRDLLAEAAKRAGNSELAGCAKP
ncbi:MAG: thioredoxin family protein [Verrucomicrobiota bacterium]|jgi:thiol-disulfide isomerase/thioredoxin